MISSRLVLAGVLSVAAACHSTTAATTPNFGASYRLMVQPEPPVLGPASLAVTVSYGGCAAQHSFALRHVVRSTGTAEIWLEKVSANEPCRMLVTERRTFSVPESVRNATTVVLLAPDDDPYPLRP